MQSAKRRIRMEDLFRLKIPTDLDLAPDGSAVVTCVKSVDAKQNHYHSHLFLVATRGGRKRQLTRGQVLDSQPRWSPDGRQIAFVSKRGDDVPQVWILPLTGGEAWQLTHLKGGPISGLRWSPDGRALLFSHRIEPREAPEQKKLRATYKHITRIAHKMDGEGFYPPERWHVWRVSFPGGRATQLTRGEHDDQEALWSPDGRRIAFVSNRIPEADYHPTNSDLYVMSAAGKQQRQVTTRFGPVMMPAWSRDGKHLYYAGNFARDGEWLRHPIHIYRISSTGGQPEDLTPDLDQWPANYLASDTAGALGFGRLFPFADPGAAARAKGSTAPERVALVLNEHGACRLYSIPATGGPLRVEMGGNVDVLGLTGCGQRGRAQVVAATIMDCGDIYTLTMDGSNHPRRLTHLNRAVLNRLQLTEPEETIFGNARNKRSPVHGWVLKPPGFRKGKRYPMVLNIHGGPMAQYGYVLFFEMHLLAAQGYVVAFSNPRGSSGYGLRFVNCIENRWGRLDYDDLMAVVDSVARRSYVDAKRLGVLGGSYGGFMTTWMVGHTQRFKAAVTQRQASNMTIQSGCSDFGFYRTYMRGSTPLETPMKHLRESPNFYANKIRTPLLIIHSEGDLRCPIAQSEELFTYLMLNRQTVEMIRFEGESHGLSRGGKPQNRRERLRRICDWFQRYL